MAAFVRILLGLLMSVAGVMMLSTTGTAAQQASCTDYSTATAAQFALDINPSLASSLDPDGNGVACDHEGPPGGPQPSTGGLQLPGTELITTPVSNIPAEATVDAIDQQLADTTDTTTITTQQPGTLDGRIGSSQAAFEAVHGATIEEIPSETNPAVTLRVYLPPPTVFDLYTVDLNDRVFIVVLVAETAWDTQQAAGIIEGYLPADVSELSSPETLQDGSLLIPIFSADLAAGVPAEVMSQSGIPGVPGDLYLLLFLDDTGGVIEMEIGIGNGDDLRNGEPTSDPIIAPTATQAPDPIVAPTATEQISLTTTGNASTFLADTRAEVDRLQAAIDELRAIIGAGTYTDPEIDRLSEIIGNWMGMDTSLPAAPPQHSAMAQQLQQIRTDISTVGLNLFLLLRAPDAANIDEAASLLDSVEVSLADLDRQLSALGV